MLVQLRRLVCLLVLLQCFLGACVVDATASETKKPIPCNDSEVQRDLERLKELKDYLPVLRDPEARAKEARVCLEIWGKAVDECKKNYGVIDSTLDLTKRIVFGHEGTKADVKWEQLNQTVSNCKSKEVQEFVRNYEGMMVKYNAAVKRTAELVEVARAKKVICDTYFDDLQHPFLRARESVWVFLPALNNETVQRCMPEDKGEEKRKTFLERYKAINDTYTQFFLLRGGTQVCRVNTGGSAGKLLNGTIALLKEKCKESPTIVSPTTAVKPPDEIDLRGSEEANKYKQVLKGAYRDKHKKDVEEFAKKKEEERKRIAAEEARKAAEAEKARRAAEEKERRDEEERKRVAAEEARKAAEAEKARRAAEEKERRDEEERKRVAAEEAEKKTKEEEAEMKKKAKKQKDGGSNPALLHVPLLLLLLCVLGCTLVC